MVLGSSSPFMMMMMQVMGLEEGTTMKASLSVFVQCSTLLGAVVLLRHLYTLWRTVLWPVFRPRKPVSSYGKWAIVTGGTDGIGKAWAMALARQKMNLLLISRSEEKLRLVQREIQQSFAVQVRILAIDFSEWTDTNRENVEACINEIQDIGLLVNNVGLSYAYPQYFHELDHETLDQLVNVNMGSAVWMMHMVLPGMVQRKRGAIINTSSGSARISSCPLLSVYAGVKKGIEQLTVSMAYEYAPKGISIQCHIPMFVTTKMSKIRKPTFFTPTPKTYVQSALANVGYETISAPYVPHALQLFVYERLPSSIVSKVSMLMHRNIRAKALKKYGKKED